MKLIFTSQLQIASQSLFICFQSRVSLSDICATILLGHMILPISAFCSVIGKLYYIPELSGRMVFTRAFTSPLFFTCCFFTALSSGQVNDLLLPFKPYDLNSKLINVCFNSSAQRFMVKTTQKSGPPLVHHLLRNRQFR